MSNEYGGVGDPNDYEWVDLSATLSSGGWSWTPSGVVNVSGIVGNSIYIALKYTSNNSQSKTWEVDELLVTGEIMIGISDQQKKDYSFGFYPNPAKDQITLSFPDSDQKELTVLSILGSEVKRERVSGNSCTITCDDLPAGVYFIRVTGSMGATGIKKLIKK